VRPVPDRGALREPDPGGEERGLSVSLTTKEDSFPSMRPLMADSA
jgi:hypothetical protein